MKKQIITLLFLICTAAGLAAETGYRGFEWGTSEFLFDIKAGEEDEPIETKDLPISTKVYRTKLLGEERNLYYYFANDMLVSALYFIPAELTDRLLNNLEDNKLIAQRSVEEEIVKQFEEGVKQIFTNEEEQDQNLRNFMLGSLFITLCFQIDDADFNQLEKQEGECLIYIYNYNNDTRLYIYKNITKGKTAVVYIPHEQDY